MEGRRGHRALFNLRSPSPARPSFAPSQRDGRPNRAAPPRVEELGEALRIASALLDTSRELSASSAAPAEVLRKLNEIVLRFAGCDGSVAFLWRREAEHAYAAADCLGFPASQLDLIRGYRFAPEDQESTRLAHAGDVLAAGGEPRIEFSCRSDRSVAEASLPPAAPAASISRAPSLTPSRAAVAR